MYDIALWVIFSLFLMGFMSRFAIFLFTISLFILILAMALHDNDAAILSGFFCIIFGAIAGGQRNVNVWN